MPWQFPDETFGKAFVQNNPGAGTADSISALVSSKNSSIVVAALDTIEEVANWHAGTVKNGPPHLCSIL